MAADPYARLPRDPEALAEEASEDAVLARERALAAQELREAEAHEREQKDSVFYDGYDAPEVAEGKVETPAGVSVVFTPKQERWWEAVTSGHYNFMAIGGAIRGTKTFTVLLTIFMLMKMFPRSRHVIVRRDLPIIRRNIVPPINKLRALTNDFLGPLNMTSWTYTAKNGSELLLMPESIKDDPLLEDFRGTEANTFTLEEANEMTAAMKSKAIERAGSWIIPPDRVQMTAIARAIERGMPADEAHRRYGPAQCPPYVFFTFNPADNWVREDIYDKYEAGLLEPPWFFMPATIYDNPFVSKAYLKSLEELKNQDPDAYERFVLGKWGDIRSEDQVIDPRWLRSAREVKARPGPKRLGGDIARYGKDSTVWAVVEGNVVAELVEEKRASTTESGTTGTNLVNERGIPHHNVVVDTGGVGGGTADTMRSNGIALNEFVMGDKPVRRLVGRAPRGAVMAGQKSFYRFHDRWSQAVWEAREKFRTGQVRLAARHPLLVRHLTCFRYEVVDKAIRVWSSKKVREELGFSPDVGVAVILGLFEFPERDRRQGAPSVVVGGYGPKRGASGARPAARRRVTRRYR